MNFFVEKAYAEVGNMVEVDAFIDRVNAQIISPLVYLVFTLAVFWFIWGMVQYIRNAENSSERETGYKHMLWSVIGMFIMISVKGIINFILATLF
jgi:hypothetical protein